MQKDATSGFIWAGCFFLMISGLLLGGYFIRNKNTIQQPTQSSNNKEDL